MVIAVFVQVLKALLERWIAPGDSLHDPLIQVTAGTIGVVGFVVHAASLAPLTGPSAWDAAAQGFLAGLSAVVSYHLLSSAPTVLVGSGTATPGHPFSYTEDVPGAASSQLSSRGLATPGTLVPATSTHVDVVTPTQEPADGTVPEPPAA